MNGNTINNEVTNPGAGATVLAGRYRVVRQLGQGGMGSVWLAEDTQLDNRKVAIKMLPSILVSNRRAYNQLKSEALVSLKLTHPNIATLRAFEENGGNPFLVVDFIDGQTLDDYLAEKGKLTEDETVRLLTPVASALDYAHGEGVVHRDVKPANVMIRRDGHPFVLDFGIAREIQETLTRVTGKLSSGTLMYMSPEQLHGAAPAPAQDVYSFAAMAYECLTGEPPFSRGQVEYQIEHDRPDPLDPRIAICGSVMAGLAKDAANRPSSCAAVLIAGRAKGVGAKRPSTGKKPLVALCVAGVLLAAGLVGVFGWQNWQQQQEAEHARIAEQAQEGVQLWKDGPYWAVCNVGASKPEDAGYYFWWGDTVGYRRVGDSWQAVDGSRREFNFSPKNCPTYDKDISQLRVEGFIDEAGNLVAGRDAATVHFGGSWRMPTFAEIDALEKNCASEWTMRNGVPGQLVSGMGNFASKSIFFPAAGGGESSDLYYSGSRGCYWSSTPNSVYSDGAWSLYFGSSGLGPLGNHRDFGRSVRPVRRFAK